MAFQRNRATQPRLQALGLPMTLLCVILGAALLAPWASDWGLQDIDWEAIQAPPSSSHWFGTDMVGRDLFTRTMAGARTSILVALIATSISLLIGILWGATAGYAGGRIDLLMMRVVDLLYGLPFILIVILLVVLFGRQTYLLFASLGAIFWLDTARIVRGQALRLRQADFVQAARCQGYRHTYIIVHHLLPNMRGPLLVCTTLTLPAIMLAESFISFLGLGIAEPSTSWGTLIADGTQSMEAAPWMLFFPGTLLIGCIWCCNTVGDRLQNQVSEGSHSLGKSHLRTPTR